MKHVDGQTGLPIMRSFYALVQNTKIRNLGFVQNSFLRRVCLDWLVESKCY
jgi:hypothetical protein